MVLTKHLFNACFKRSLSSALYIPGDRAHLMFVILKPVIDFEERIKSKPELELNIKARQSNIDIQKVENRWNFYKHFEDQKIILETTRTVIVDKLKNLAEQKDSKNDEVIQQLKTHLNFVKDDLHALKDYLYGVEEDTLLQVLSLPNVLHADTPHENETIIHSYLEKPTAISDCHMKASSLIEYTNAFFYFLKNEAAHFELATVNYFSDSLLKSSHTQFSNSDFCRSIIVDGCASNFSSKLDTFTLEAIHNDTSHELSRLHVTGGASLYAFMAYFARHSIQESYLPLKLFTPGRKFCPVDSTTASLFNVHQETAIELFIATKDDVELEKQFKELTQTVIQIYTELGQHFRLVYIPANKLKKHESLRLSIQMFSNKLQQYVEVGNCSICDSYLSKRLLFTYSVNKERKYPKVISGSLLRVQPLLACTLENNNLCGNLFNNVLKDYVLFK